MQGKRRTAVITDTVSSGFYFPLWHRYYSRQVGAENLFVILHGPSINDFSSYELGGLWRLNTYNNAGRCKTIAETCALLLNEYDYVIRVDTDEFIAADPRHFPTLSDYLEKLRRPYVTAAGYNVVAELGSASLDFAKPILGAQRMLCYPYDALNKTCIIGLPIAWAPGFHFASIFSEFDGLSLFHLKYADVEMQVAIGAAVAAQSDETLFQEYHRASREKIEANISTLSAFERHRGWEQFDRPNYRSNFLGAIRFTPNYDGVYHGSAFAPERVLLEIPNEFGLSL